MTVTGMFWSCRLKIVRMIVASCSTIRIPLWSSPQSVDSLDSHMASSPAHLAGLCSGFSSCLESLDDALPVILRPHLIHLTTHNLFIISIIVGGEVGKTDTYIELCQFIEEVLGKANTSGETAQ